MIFRFTPEQTDKIFFTADQHFAHANIIEFCKRPYKDVHQMDSALVENWNNTVPHDGIVFHLGDFCLNEAGVAAQFFEALNGKIYIIGIDWHHDKRWLEYARRAESYDPIRTYDEHKIEILSPEFVIEITDEKSKYPHPTIHLSHYPIGDWDRKYHGGWHLHGHSHGNHKGDNHLTGEMCWDVGVDAVGTNYAPVSFGAILEWAYECGWGTG